MSYYRTLSLLLCLITTPLIAEELVILHTNDFHGHIKATQRYAGAAKISAYVDDLKARHPAVIFLDAGDAISGTPVSGMFKGDPIFEVMNLMGYDFGLIGNHEFDRSRLPKNRPISRDSCASTLVRKCTRPRWTFTR